MGKRVKPLYLEHLRLKETAARHAALLEHMDSVQLGSVLPNDLPMAKDLLEGDTILMDAYLKMIDYTLGVVESILVTSPGNDFRPIVGEGSWVDFVGWMDAMKQFLTPHLVMQMPPDAEPPPPIFPPPREGLGRRKRKLHDGETSGEQEEVVAQWQS